MSQLDPVSYAEINRIHASLTKDGPNSVLLTSTLAGEGTSLATYLLAAANAKHGNKTLIIDLNLKNAGLSYELGFKPQKWGLPERKANQTIKALCDQTEAENLFILPAPADSETVEVLKDPKGAKSFINKASKEFDNVYIDTTPISAHNRGNVDPVLLASLTTQSVLVALAGKTARERIKSALRQLEEGGASVTGVVINDWKNTSTREELLHMANFLGFFSEGLRNWLRHKIYKGTSI